jgi:hypothetical protein
LGESVNLIVVAAGESKQLSDEVFPPIVGDQARSTRVSCTACHELSPPYVGRFSAAAMPRSEFAALAVAL